MRLAVAVAIVLLALVPSGQFGPVLVAGARAQHSASSIRVSASKEQLTLVMVIPKRAYARGATVPVTLRLHNSGSDFRVLWVWACHNPPYGVQVLNRKGRVVYPPATPTSGGLPCTGNAAPGLGPGRSTTYHVKVILSGPFIRARIPFGVPMSSGDTREVLSTVAVHVGNF